MTSSVPQLKPHSNASCPYNTLNGWMCNAHSEYHGRVLHVATVSLNKVCAIWEDEGKNHLSPDEAGPWSTVFLLWENQYRGVTDAELAQAKAKLLSNYLNMQDAERRGRWRELE